ncbi:GTPase family protein [Romeria aff. gracilis LEGE 07310]|uniref:GTPase family protein n=1 Tax=Vasconcelosia minhoensis LEGE 07310 TaxID=915328 RepID=A0A8J7AE58_9CYAN|nr:GTPase family protein [Romeria gracilis]MBE9077819.1 GTPase family protein [Romeria aff. gracilis LEGE 07310]
MIRLKPWQVALLIAPIAAIAIFIVVVAGIQIRAWGINWIWAIVVLLIVGWQRLLARWTTPALNQFEALATEVSEELEAATDADVAESADPAAAAQAEAALEKILQTAQADPPLWEDAATFWQRCQELIVAIAQVYNPEVKRPLLNIYVPQAYDLLRGTVDDMDQWMAKLGPALNQVSVGQVYEGYEVYRKLEPSAKKLLKVWQWSQWVLNPAAAVARQASLRYSNQAGQQLLFNLGQLLREAALRNLGRQAITLYGGTAAPTVTELSPAPTALPKAKTQTLREILDQAKPAETVAQQPVNILLVGRTGAGKSSLINTLFQAEKAAVDVLPSTDQVQNYHWQTPSGEALTLWDTPGYEQVNREDLREAVLDFASRADLLLLVTPALDPALQMDVDFLQALQTAGNDLSAIAIVTQVDRLRPIREWSPPYDWQSGDRPKEKAIREATAYRAEQLGEPCDQVLPLVTRDRDRPDWGTEMLSLSLIEAISPAKQLRLARFLRNREARTVAAARIIDRYTFQMATTQGLTSLLKSPVLQFISTLTTGTPTLAYLLAEKIPVEELPVVIGKLQMAYDLYNLLNEESERSRSFDLLTLWPLLLENPTAPDRNAWAFGHALVEYWSQGLSIDQLRQRFEAYLGQTPQLNPAASL